MKKINASKRLPDFIGIGTRRCGSSWIHRVLNSHPEIGKPESGLHYFSTNADEGIFWYMQQLEAYSKKKYILEFSVSYSYPEFCHQSANKIIKEVPAAKLFICIRSPVLRAYSDYLRSIRMDEISADLSFESAIKQYPIFLERSQYARILKPYYDLFSGEQLKVFFYDDLAKDPVAFAAELANFFGVPNTFDANVVNSREPVGKTVRSEYLNKTIRETKNILDKGFNYCGFGEQWSNWKARHVEVYEKSLDLTLRDQMLDKQFATQLSKQFEEDIFFIEDKTGKNLHEWYDF